MKTNYDKEYILESKKIYKEADDQLCKEYRYRQIKKRSNTYYIENKEKVKQRSKTHYKENKQMSKEYHKQYYEINKIKIKKYYETHKILKKNQTE